MKSLVKWSYILSVALVFASATACSDKDGDKTNEPANPGTDTGTVTPDPTAPTEVLPAEESKEYLEDVAQELLGKFNSSEQQAVINAARYVERRYSDLDLPDNFDSDDEPYSPVKVAAAIRSLVTKGDVTASGALYSCVYRFSDYVGVYEPGVDRWIRIGDSDAVVFRCKGENGNIELRAVASSDRWTDTRTYDDTEYTVYVPKTVTVTFTEGTTVHVKAVLKTDKTAGSASISADIKVANLKADVAIRADDRSLKATQRLAVNGETVLASECQAVGNRFGDLYDAIRNEADIAGMVTEVSGRSDFLGKVQVRATAKGAAIDVLRRLHHHSGDEMRAQCAMLNSNTDGKIYYGSDIVQGTIVFTPVLDYEYYGSQHWALGYNIEFAADGSREDIGSYFEVGFDAVVDRFRNLLDSYSEMF